jgi:type II secretory pathway predicted ATPase ExeA
MPTSAEIAKLRKNPFTLVAEANTDIWADYENVLQALLDVITSCRTDQVGLSEFVVLHGEIGTGKSHALRYLQHYIMNKHVNEFRSPCVYLESTKLAKKTDFIAIYRRVMESLRNHAFETANRLDSAFEEQAKSLGLTKSQDVTNKKTELWKNNAEELAPQFPSLIHLLHGMVN